MIASKSSCSGERLADLVDDASSALRCAGLLDRPGPGSSADADVLADECQQLADRPSV